MRLIGYGLSIGEKKLFKDVNVEFDKNSISHVLGNNGTGKSSFAKSCVGMMKYEGIMEGNENTVLIGSSSNVPGEFSIQDIMLLLRKRYDPQKVQRISDLLNLQDISAKLSISKMSDGQKQKIKLLTFLSTIPKVIILDEFTTALDKSSSLELYRFINEYVRLYKVTAINITHNLSDLEYMPGKYFYISNFNITEIESKDIAIEKYVKGE